MPRGGAREGAGRKTTWESGCKFEDTKVIRVPKAIAINLLKIAHRLDKGEDLELETKSLRKEVSVLKAKIKTLKSLQNPQPTQLNLLPGSSNVDVQITKLRKRAMDQFLSMARQGQQAKSSKAAASALRWFEKKVKEELNHL